MQTILGSGGAIGIELAKALTAYTKDIRLVSRNPQKVNDSDTLFPADLLNPEELKTAIKGSEIVYVTVGFPYSYAIWKEKWPPFIDHLLEACALEGCKLVFFDNIYMYGADQLNPITEEATINPPSKKGEVRAAIAGKIMEYANSGKVNALIARSADFYGPSIKNNSMLTETVFNPLSKGKAANWLMNDSMKHSFSYTPDLGKATALLGNTDSAYGQVWHLPTASNPMTGKEWIETVAKELGVKPKSRVASRFMVRILGLFIPVMKETVEMLYQYDRPYVFDSSKFEQTFDFTPTPYAEGIKEIIRSDYA